MKDNKVKTSKKTIHLDNLKTHMIIKYYLKNSKID